MIRVSPGSALKKQPGVSLLPLEPIQVRVLIMRLAELCRAYWPPIYGYLRRHGYDTQDAQDLTQSFSSTCSKTKHSVERPVIRAGSEIFFWAPSRFASRTNRPAAIPSSAEGIPR